MKSTALFGIFLAATVTACSAAGDRVRAYQGPQRAQEDVAVLDCNQAGWRTDFIVYHIDGEMGPIKPRFNADAPSHFGLSSVIELTPGPHVLDVVVFIGGSSGRAVVEHEFAAGKRYKLLVGVDMPPSTRVAALIGLPTTSPMHVWVEELP